LKSCEGGWSKANLVDEPIGGASGRVKHLGTIEIEPMTIELGMSGAKEVLQWIQGSWNRQWDRRSGEITHADFNLKETYEHWFYDALITEVTFPALDGAAKDPAYLKCKIQPERVRTVRGSKKDMIGKVTEKQKLWTPSSFRLTIDQFAGMEYVNKLEAFTITQGIKKMYIGQERYPQIEPTGIKFPNLSGTISLAYADALLKWHHDYIANFTGTKDPHAQLSGAIEFLTPDRASTIFRIELTQVGIMSAAIQQASANTDQIKRVKFEMFVGSMKIDGGSVGME
jgi:hypothetical protein